MRTRTLLTGAGLGVGIMYLCDPRIGQRRRAVLREQLANAAHKASNIIDLFEDARAGHTPERVDDDALAERVRARIGRAIAYASAITVSAEHGTILLRGPVLADHAERLLRRVGGVHGVRQVDNQLELHEQADLPELRSHTEEPVAGQPALSQERWSPATRAFGSALGAGLMAYGLRHRDLRGALAGAVGAALLARSITDVDLDRIVSIASGRAAVEIHDSLTIAAPVEQVFDLWTNYENFPRFMSNVQEVQAVGYDESRWKVRGPGGLPIEWSAVLTQLVQDELLAWKTVPNSIIRHEGEVRFSPELGGHTRVNVRLSYNPGIGGLGHAFASLFGANPKSQLAQDLTHMKTFIETGVAPSDATKEKKSRAKRAPASGRTQLAEGLT